ncbi:MAG: glycosyltransferase [Rhodothermia bacterium]|nr:glycosyltransferase [Rhodothermia bacterium]
MTGRRGSQHTTARHLPLRIALYSHDTCGLGHLRRNLAIAETLRSKLSADILLISGIREAGSFSMPNGIDTLLLPALAKIDNLKYEPRRLGVGLSDLVAIRSNSIRAAMTSFRPDVFIVDNVPRGAVGELDATLDALRTNGYTRCVLGLRDVLDTPDNVQQEWSRNDNIAAIRELYDAVWIYGDRDVFDGVRAYDFPEFVRRKTVFTGYIRPIVHPGGRGSQIRPGESPDMCIVGGGHDGARLASVFAQACALNRRKGMILTGPFMSDVDARRLGTHPDVSVRRFSTDPTQLYRAASRVVAMGGYNTVLELLSLGKRPLIVPRVSPRKEQLVRARAFSARDLVDLLHPEDLSAERIANWIAADQSAPIDTSAAINMGGLDTIVDQVKKLTASPALALTG